MQQPASSASNAKPTATITVPKGALPDATPTRRSARISVNSDFRMRSHKGSVTRGIVLNVSDGGALLFCLNQLEDDEAVQVELAEPIFPVSRLVNARVRHVEPASKEIVAMLHQKERLSSKENSGYLIGVEFTRIDVEDLRTLRKFVRSHVKDEYKRRSSTVVDPRHMSDAQGNISLRLTKPGRSGESAYDSLARTAFNRSVRVKKLRTPAIAFSIGLLGSAFIFYFGFFNGWDSGFMALRMLAFLCLAWLIGYLLTMLWAWLDDWRDEDATIFATTDGATDNIDEILADADTLLGVPDDGNETKDQSIAEDIPKQSEALNALAAQATA
jgi:PilZ domain